MWVWTRANKHVRRLMISAVQEREEEGKEGGETKDACMDASRV